MSASTTGYGDYTPGKSTTDLISPYHASSRLACPGLTYSLPFPRSILFAATQADKLYCIFFLPLSVAVFGEVLGRIASIYITRRTRQAEYKHLKRSITQCDLRKMDSNRDGKVDMEEFMSFMLVALQKVDQESIDDIKSIFYSLDADGNGVLEKDDLVALSQRRTWHEIQMTARRAEDDEDDRHEQ